MEKNKCKADKNVVEIGMLDLIIATGATHYINGMLLAEILPEEANNISNRNQQPSVIDTTTQTVNNISAKERSRTVMSTEYKDSVQAYRRTLSTAQ